MTYAPIIAHLAGDYLLQSLPQAPGHDLPDESLRHAVLGSELPLRDAAVDVATPDLSDDGLSKPRATVVLAAGTPLRPSSRPVRIAARNALGTHRCPVPPTTDHVGHVLSRSTRYQMQRITAGRVIARVTDEWLIRRNRADSQLVCEAVRSDSYTTFCLSVPVKQAVATRHQRARPRPAGVWSASPIDLAPERCNISFRESIHNVDGSRS